MTCDPPVAIFESWGLYFQFSAVSEDLAALLEEKELLRGGRQAHGVNLEVSLEELKEDFVLKFQKTKIFLQVISIMSSYGPQNLFSCPLHRIKWLGYPINLHVSHWTNQPRENSNITNLHVNHCQSQQHANKKRLGSQWNQVNHCLSFCNAVS